MNINNKILQACLLISLFFTTSCNRQDSIARSKYVKSTLPYQSECLLHVVKNQRFQHINDMDYVILENTLFDNMLRLYLCINDPNIKDPDKKYAKNVLAHIIAFAKDKDLAYGYKKGIECEMIPDDIVLPAKMKVRDVYDKIMNEKDFN